MKRLGNLLGLGGMVLLLVLWALLLRPAFLGGTMTYIVVRGNSMLPTYQAGDLVAVRADATYADREIVAYRVPRGEVGEDSLVLHRIVGGDSTHGFEAWGDNNPNPDPWSPRPSDIVGKAWFVLPGFGTTIAFVRQPVIAGGVAAGLVVFLVLIVPPKSAKPSKVGARRPAPSHRSAR